MEDIDKKVNRIEVIDEGGRQYVNNIVESARIVTQDEGRTLKMFIRSGFSNYAETVLEQSRKNRSCDNLTTVTAHSRLKCRHETGWYETIRFWMFSKTVFVCSDCGAVIEKKDW